MSGCRAGCGHYRTVEEYRLWRLQWEQDLEQHSAGWDAEAAEFKEQYPPPTFGDWLRDGAYSTSDWMRWSA